MLILGDDPPLVFFAGTPARGAPDEDVLQMGARRAGRGRALRLGAFLYFIPPFFTTPEREGMATRPDRDRHRGSSRRAIAARGRYIVMTAGCIAATRRTTQGPT
jgi:hypothetical protein